MIRVRRTPRLLLSLAVLAASAGTWAGCGKKGPPLAPLRPAPGRIEDLKIRRLGDEVYLQFTVPSKNADGRGPADVERVNVYAVTGDAVDRYRQPLSAKDFDKYATKVASIEIQPPPEPVEEEEADAAEPAQPAPPPQPPQAPPDGRPVQGQLLSVVERLTAAQLTRFVPPGKAPTVKVVAPTPPVVQPPIPRAEPPLSRIYVAMARSRKDVFGPVSARLSVPLAEVPPTPPAPRLDYTESAISAAWSAPVGARLPIQLPSPAAGAAAATAGTPAAGVPAPAAAGLAAGTPPPAAPGAEGQPAEPPPLVSRLRLPFPVPVPHTYNVYEVAADGTPAGTPPGEMPKPLNPQPLGVLTFADRRVTFGVERCYAVRTVEVVGQVTLESAPSAPACVTPRDTFAPAAPRGLAAVGGEGAINLIWEPNAEADLAGYIILRGEVGGGALQPLVEAPVAGTTYRDATVRPGVRYVYAVVAADTASPPNVSGESNRVEETAR